MALIISSENSMVSSGKSSSSGEIKTISTSSASASSTSLSTAATSGLSIRPGAGGIFFSTANVGKKTVANDATVTTSNSKSSSTFLEDVLRFTAKNAKKGKEWFGEEYVPEMSNSILPHRKLGDESDIIAILKKAESGGRGIGEEGSKHDTLVSVCGIETVAIEQVWAHLRTKSGLFSGSVASDEFKYRDLRVVRVQKTALNCGSASAWSFIKPTTAGNTKPYVVDSALFLSDIAILPIDISAFSSKSSSLKSLKEAFSTALARPTLGAVKAAQGTSFMKKATSYLQTPHSLYNTLVKLQVNGGGSTSAGKDGLLRNTIVLLLGSFTDDGSLLNEIRKEITDTVVQVMQTFGTSSSAVSNFSVVSAPTVKNSFTFLMPQLSAISRTVEDRRMTLASTLELNQGLKMQIVCVFTINGEIIVCSRVLTGSVAVGEVIEIGPFPGVKDAKYERDQLRKDTWKWSTDMSFSVTETVEAIKHFDRFVSTAYAGQLVGIRISKNNFDSSGKLKSSVASSNTSRGIAGSRAFNLHTGLVMSSTKWRCEADCPVDVAIPSVSEFEIGSLEYTDAAMKSLNSGRQYTVTCGSFEGEATVMHSKPGSIIFRTMICDSMFIQPDWSTTVVSTVNAVATDTARVLDTMTVSAGGLVLAAGKVVKAEYRCRKLLSTDFTSVVMILRRILPYELVHSLLEYATPDAIKPFSRKEQKEEIQCETKQERRV